MKYLITALLLLLFNTTYAQVQPFGQIDTADLRLTDCDFEKGANAMVLFAKGSLRCEQYYNKLSYHKRIKILTEGGKNEANIRIEYISKRSLENIKDIVAQTINLEGNVIKITPVDKKQIFIEKVDKYRKAVVITFPEVRKGSIIELKYTWESGYPNFYPRWYFQEDIPVRYSELVADVQLTIDFFAKVNQDYAKDTNDKLGPKDEPMVTRRTWAMANVHAYKTEPYAPASEEYKQGIFFFRGRNFSSWTGLAYDVAEDVDFGLQLKKQLSGTEKILAKAATLKNNDKKIASIFNDVKNAMLWNNVDNWYTEDGIKKAWDKKTGNSAEINLILYKLLTTAGIHGYPVLVSTPGNGLIEPGFASLSQMDKAVVFVPVDSVAYYILDASNKKNLYNQIPYDLLNTQGLAVNMDDKKTSNAIQGKLFTISCFTTISQRVNINAAISANSKMTGLAQIHSFSYGRAVVIKRKDEPGVNYADLLKNRDNEITINSLKFENTETDTLPLIQQVDFVANLSQSEGDYIIFNTNLFSDFRINPFTSEARFTSVEFPYPTNYTITGHYTIPPNYTVETLPKSISIKTEDNGIVVRRIVAQEGNIIATRYVVNRLKSFYTKEEYPALKEFYKKLFEVLNEPVVLKKP
jgi:hypothetical protein